MGSSVSIIPLGIMLVPPVSINNELKRLEFYESFTCISYRHTNRHTDAPTCIIVAPDTLHILTKFQL